MNIKLLENITPPSIYKNNIQSEVKVLEYDTQVWDPIAQDCWGGIEEWQGSGNDYWEEELNKKMI